MNRRSGLTMVELLSSLVVVAVLLSAGGRLFRDGWVSLHRAIRHVDHHQTVLLLMRRWQMTVGATSPRTWRVDAATFQAGTLSVRQEAGRLVFRRDAEVRASYDLGGRACAFGIEKNPGTADCAILAIAAAEHTPGSRRGDALRIVACGGVE